MIPKTLIFPSFDSGNAVHLLLIPFLLMFTYFAAKINYLVEYSKKFIKYHTIKFDLSSFAMNLTVFRSFMLAFETDF